ncbi:uncharacterized protein LOC123309352 [Coccinella septempunctata]|uniref:uncharacterized protein LOC123309352 n=1 Tax=Coccinella septempunctata TaxID=41139 RepID=UPI001D09537A|nr:uncharacterized protein LOC123309352 [Coccinella septempunctata]
MKYTKILISLLSISLIDCIYAAGKVSKSSVGNSGVIVESVEVSNNSSLEVKSKEHVEAKPPHKDVLRKVTTEVTTEISNKMPEVGRIRNITGIDDDPNYARGTFGGYYFIGTERSKNYYFHGKYQKPSLHYYGNYNHTLEDKSTLGYYLGYGMSKMDHNEYFRHHHYTGFKVHHYFFKNSTMLSEQYVGSDHLVQCARNTSVLCPENTEPICLQNTTVWCASKISLVKPCEFDASLKCVTTKLPCVKSDDPKCDRLVETVKMPCIAKIKILDPMEDKNGLTLISIAGTFVLAPAVPILDRTYCIAVVAEPSIN